MDKNKREVKFTQENVTVSLAGPLKDEARFIGKLLIIEECHGPVIEWQPLKNQEEKNSSSPETETLDWEDISSSVGFKANHNDGLDAVEINQVRIPKEITFEIADLKSYKKTELLSEKHVFVTFLKKDGSNVPAFQFNVDDFDAFNNALGNYISFKKSTKGANLYLARDPKEDALDKSFSQLDLFNDGRTQPAKLSDHYSAALGGFAKVTNFLFDYMIYGNETEPSSTQHENSISEMMSFNIVNVNIDHQEEPGYELITRIDLPPRPDVKRAQPLTLDEWQSFIDSEGRMIDVPALKYRIFKGGLSENVRSEAWKYLLGYYDFNATHKEQQVRIKEKNESYFRMKLQWKTISADQESRFSALRERKSLIEKDASRTDRTHPFYFGENNPNIQILQDILMTYCMHNFDLGYVQGMSDLLSPILVVMENETDAFWCFTGWLDTVGSNFEFTQEGIQNQLLNLHRLLHYVDPQLCRYLEQHESGNLYFAFRWLLILFKRDFKFQEVMRLWEVLWTGFPCKNFHLLLCLAILDSEKLTITENKYGLTEILKHVNEMSYKINLDETLCKAEAMYLQIKSSEYQSDVVQTILGIEPNIKSIKPICTEPRSTPVEQSTSSFSIDEYVDLEKNYQLPFDLFT